MASNSPRITFLCRFLPLEAECWLERRTGRAKHLGRLRRQAAGADPVSAARAAPASSARLADASSSASIVPRDQLRPGQDGTHRERDAVGTGLARLSSRGVHRAVMALEVRSVSGTHHCHCEYNVADIPRQCQCAGAGATNNTPKA